MLKKFFVGTAMAAAVLIGGLAIILLPILAALYAAEAFGPLGAAGAAFVSLCIIMGAAQAVFD